MKMIIKLPLFHTNCLLVILSRLQMTTMNTHIIFIHVFLLSIYSYFPFFLLFSIFSCALSADDKDTRQSNIQNENTENTICFATKREEQKNHNGIDVNNPI